MNADREALVQALRRHLRALTVEIGPRAPAVGDSLDRAERYVRACLEDAGLVVERRPYAFRFREVTNLVARPQACDPHAPFWLVGAHYDTVPTTPGADDNASALAVMLELARRFAASSLPLRFVAFTMEEPPAHLTSDQGSRVFVRELARRGETVRGAVILEMVGYTCERQHYPLVLRWAGYPRRGDFVGIVGERRSRALVSGLVASIRRHGRPPVESLVVPLRGWLLPATRLSDHAAFWDAGIPAVMVTDTAFFRNPHYHLPSDTMDTLDFAFMADLVEALEAALRDLAPAPPQAGGGVVPPPGSTRP